MRHCFESLANKRMEIILNGQPFDCQKAANIANLVSILELDPRSIAIELNREIVPKSQWEATFLSPADKVEIVQFVGGG